MTHFPREKATFFGVKMHLELRSPMFGESCVLIFYRRHPMELIKLRRDLCQKLIVDRFKSKVEFDHASEETKTAFEKPS